MALIDCLPNEVLLRVFSYLKGYELLQVEKVCERWDSLCVECVWNRFTKIRYGTIGISREDRVQNFVDIVRRVRQVNDLSILQPVSGWHGLNPGQREAVMNAMMELVRKRSPDTVLSSRFIQDIISLGYSMDRNQPQQEPSLLEARVAIAKVLDGSQFCEFGTFELHHVHVHGSDALWRCFSVYFKSHIVPLSLDLSHFTRLRIEDLEIIISIVDNEEAMAARNHLHLLSLFTRVRTVEVEKIRLNCLLDGRFSDPTVEMLVGFSAHRYELSIDEFLTFLKTLADKDDIQRNRKILDYLDQWKNGDNVEVTQITINSSEFHRIEALVQSREHRLNDPFQQRDAVDIFLAHVIPSLVDHLHLVVTHECNELDRLLSLLVQKGVVNSLEEFSIIIEDPVDEEEEFVIDWNSFVGYQRVEQMLQCFSGNLDSVETLEFGFDDWSDVTLNCASKIHSSSQCSRAAMSSTQGDLQAVDYRGLPCFAFAVSAVSLTPHLIRLSVSTEPLGDESLCVEWVSKLLDAVDGRESLRTMGITVEPPRSQVFRLQDRRVRVIGQSGRTKEEDQVLLAAIDRQLHHLVATLHRLQDIEVSIVTHGYHFKWNR